MRRHWLSTGCLAALLLTLCAGRAFAQATRAPMKLDADYRVTGRYPVPGDGDWDYINIDSAARRLYVSHGDFIQVLHADSGKLIGKIPAPGAHGVALVQSLHRGFTSNGGDKTVTVFDTKTLTVIQTLKIEYGTDNIIYEPFSNRVFALSDEPTAIDPSTDQIIGNVSLGAGSEGAVSNGKGELFIAVPKQNAIAVVDPKTLSMRGTFSTKPCQDPRTLEFDSVDHHLLVGCRDRFIVLDSDTGKVVAGSLQCAGVDSAAYDPEDKLIFESCSEGVITVIRQMTKTNFRTIATIPTQIWARTMGFDPATKKIYLPVAEFEFIPNANPQKPPNRRWKSGTFAILVVTKQ